MSGKRRKKTKFELLLHSIAVAVGCFFVPFSRLKKSYCNFSRIPKSTFSILFNCRKEQFLGAERNDFHESKKELG